ncbi:MAG: biotin--[acetyl-CoA-carboxylase] ligase [Smithella sp.]|nr:biotin--[acetyl-CoA-carboxylase] ligase [Smithella sp.]MDM7987305.1 biotin--[acetyl-CoA-carboxylase] ligase [Smithella sp.]HOU50061.1 biotin--[acetyl-CoA-carboxylase] ligase [Smithella sp.]HQI72603.1 biotin--[acetyl-CoA-carboxylase] ligase [Smithella sp.]
MNKPVNIDWDLKKLKDRFAVKLFGHPLYYFSETGSTNDEALALGNAGVPEGTVVLADRQSRGKGRFQRIWHSPAGSNVYTSIILKPQIASSEASQIPIMAGVAVAETLNAYCPDPVNVKWPNDVLIHHKKVCGILSQAKLTGKKIDFIVLGIGINVNLQKKELSKEIRDTATSLAIETGGIISRMDLIISLYENLEKWYKKLIQEGFDPIKKCCLKMMPMIGQTVQVAFGEELLEGKATGMDDDGALILLTEKNREIRVSAGDATIKR